MDYAKQERLYQEELARKAAANKQIPTVSTPKKKKGLDPSAWISEAIGTTAGLLASPLGPAASAVAAAYGSGVGKVIEQKVKKEAIKPKDVASEAIMSGLFTYGPIKSAKGLLGIASGQGLKGFQTGAAKAAETATKEVAKGTLSKKQLEAIDMLGKAWGINPGVALPGGKAIGVEKAGKLQNFAKNVLGLGKTTAAIDVMNKGEVYKKATAKVISDQLSGTAETYAKQTLLSDLKKSFEKILGAGQIPKSTLLLPTDTAAQRTAKLAISQGKKSATKANQFIDDIYRTITLGGDTHETIWNLRKLVDKQMVNFSKGTDAASSLAQSIGQATRSEINKILKSNKVVGEAFKNYTNVNDILELVAPVVKAPKGTYIPGAGRIGGKTTQRVQSLVGQLLGGGTEAGATTTQKTGTSLLKQVGNVASSIPARQLYAATLRNITPQPGIPAEQAGAISPDMTAGLTNMGTQKSIAPDPRLNAIRAAIVKDMSKTGGKNLKNIQTIANAYGIDLTPLGLGTTAKTGFAALTADQQKRISNLNTVAAALNALEQSVASSGLFPQESQALSSLLGTPRRIIGQAINPEQRTYLSSIRSRGIQIIRALGEVGNLSASEQDAAIRLLPQPGDNAQTASSKIAQLRALFSDVSSRVANPQIGTFQ